MSSIKISNLPYRKNVSCITFKKDKFLLIQNNDWLENWWKFPQGGVDGKENIEKAALRELKEELGNDKFKIIKKSKITNQYDWNSKSLKLSGYQWRGQIQHYLLVEFIGKEEDIQIDLQEIRQYKWLGLDEIWENIDHKDKNFTNYRATIEKVFQEFGIIKKK